jgi:hypothetical protein
LLHSPPIWGILGNFGEFWGILGKSSALLGNLFELWGILGNLFELWGIYLNFGENFLQLSRKDLLIPYYIFRRDTVTRKLFV